MRVKVLLILIGLTVLCLKWSYADDTPVPAMLRVSLLEGDITYQRADLDRWIELSINTPILEGDKIWVGNQGRLEIELENGNFARFAENSMIEVLRLTSSDSSEVEFRLNQGTATFALSSVPPALVVDAPLFATQIKKAATFRFDVDENGSGRIVLFEGDVDVASENTRLILRHGEIVRFSNQDPDQYYLETNYIKDDWDRWNEDRTNYIAQITQEPLQYRDQGWSNANLYEYGNWYDDSTYGSVWRPSVGVDWVPFRDGRWVWYSSMGWTWISYEPWGWIPYHYGRWAYINQRGWSWVPGRNRVAWCPGAVNWVQGPSWLGWVPLAPHEPFYAARNSANVFISKNFEHRSGVTYWHRDQFLNGTPVPNFQGPRDPYTQGRIIAGQPHVSPTIASRMPVVGSPAHTVTNAELEARRALRQQIVRSSSSPSQSTAELNRMRAERGRLNSAQNRTNSSSTRPDTVSIPADTSTSMQGQDNSTANRQTVLTKKRERIYSIDGSSRNRDSSNREVFPSDSSRSTWVRPSSTAAAPAVNSTSSSSQIQPATDLPGSRQRVYEMQRNRVSTNDRYSGQPAQREPAPRYVPPSSAAPVTNPQGPLPSYRSHNIQPVGPPPQIPASAPRAVVQQSQSQSNTTGSANRESRSESRGRPGRE